MISGKLVRAKARILGTATALALSAIALPATAQPYPSRSITMLVGYSAGGQADALARIIGKQLGENLKVSVIIENKTGANGASGRIPDRLPVRCPVDEAALKSPRDPGALERFSLRWHTSLRPGPLPPR